MSNRAAAMSSSKESGGDEEQQQREGGGGDEEHRQQRERGNNKERGAAAMRSSKESGVAAMRSSGPGVCARTPLKEGERPYFIRIVIIISWMNVAFRSEKISSKAEGNSEQLSNRASRGEAKEF